MRPLFSREGLQELSQLLASSTPLLAFDFDGTLAPIVPHPQEATLPTIIKDLLDDLSHRLPCAVISGRKREDLKQKLHGLTGIELIGNHGIEGTVSDSLLHQDQELVRQWMDVLTQRLGSIPGVEIENKEVSVSVHFRNVQLERPTHLKLIEDIIQGLPHSRRIGGKEVWNLVPEGSPNKGTALLQLMERRNLQGALFIGDDVTDEDVFRVSAPSRILTVRVGVSGPSAARFYLNEQAEIQKLLEQVRDLLNDRAPSPRRLTA